VMKVDTEQAEWPFFRNTLTEDGDQLDSVRQLLLEIHSPRLWPQRVTKEDAVEMAFYAQELQARGFKVFSNRQRHRCGLRYSPMMPPGIREKRCQETSYVNSAMHKGRNFIASHHNLETDRHNI